MGRIVRWSALAALVVTLAVGCSEKSKEPFRDSAISGRNEEPARVITFPDGFSNMAAKCDGPNMVYSPYKGDNNRTAIAVAPNDPRCTR